MNAMSKWLLGFMLAVGCVPGWAANLVLNPDFDTDLSGWTTSGVGLGSVTRDATDGSPTAGSMFLNANSAADAAHAQQCVAVSAPQNVDFFLRSDALSPGGSITISAVAFGSGGCTGTNLGPFIAFSLVSANPVSGIPGPWFDQVQATNSNQSLPAGTASVMLHLDVSGGLAQYLVDRVRFGPTGTTPVILQSFNIE